MNSCLSLESGYAIYITIKWYKRDSLEIADRRYRAPCRKCSPQRRNVIRPANLAAARRAIARRRKEEGRKKERKKQSAKIQGRSPQLHVMQFRRRTSKHCRRPRAKTLALLRPEATLYVPCVISREGIKETLSRLEGFRCSTRTFDLRPLWSWWKLQFWKHVAL